ncbi:hypothetical protein LCGC14_2444430 [marine sediment metagenome]|uniref:Uncharacterized protein n=1 Tax=marine sediment metagenome TaxID=412755 RepID=A0A0F9C5F7_9ZZZZ
MEHLFGLIRAFAIGLFILGVAAAGFIIWIIIKLLQYFTVI